MRAVVVILIVVVALLIIRDATARPPVPPDVFKAVRHYWKTPADRVEAFNIVSCETGGRYNTTARNGQYLGLFQAGSWFRARYGHGYTADAQARAAHLGWLELGWSQWECA